MTYLTPREIAERWKVRPRTVRNRIARGELVAVRVGALLRVAHQEVRRYESQNATTDNASTQP